MTLIDRILLAVYVGLTLRVAPRILEAWSGDPTQNEFFLRDRLAYQHAADRLADTGSPYADQLVAGPIANGNIEIGYFYPPPVAQLVSLVDPAFSTTTIVVWVFIQAVVLTAALALVAIHYLGPRRGVLAVLICGMSYPLHFAVFGGNVSGWITAAVAIMLLGGHMPALLAGALTLLKLTPAPLLVGALASPRRLSALAVGLGLTLVSVAASPAAWAEWLVVLPNIFRIPLVTDNSGNTSPGGVLSAVGLAHVGQVIGVVICLASGLIALGRAFRNAPVQDWVAPAVVSYLFASPTMWDHYQAVMLPVAIARWSQVSAVGRRVLMIGAMWHLLMWFDAVSLAPLRLVGLAVLLAVSWVVISPSRRDFATLRDVARSLVPRPRAAPPKLAEG